MTFEEARIILEQAEKHPPSKVIEAVGVIVSDNEVVNFSEKATRFGALGLIRTALKTLVGRPDAAEDLKATLDPLGAQVPQSVKEAQDFISAAETKPAADIDGFVLASAIDVLAESLKGVRRTSPRAEWLNRALAVAAKTGVTVPNMSVPEVESSDPTGKITDLERRLRGAAANAGVPKAVVDIEVTNYRRRLRETPEQASDIADLLEMRIAELEAATPPGPAPIGVAPDFVAQRQYVDRAGEMRPQVSRDFYSIKPRYFDGDELSPAGLDPATIATLQDRLVSAGLMEPGEFWSGFWDDGTTVAHKRALGMANSGGKGVDDTIDELIATLPEAIKEQRARLEASKTFQAPPFMRPDAAMLAQTVKSAVRSELQRDPSQTELDDLAGMLSSLYRQDYDADVAAARSEFDAVNNPLEVSGGAVVQDVDPIAQFRQALEARFKPEMDRLSSLPDVRDNMSNVFSSLRTMSSLIG